LTRPYKPLPFLLFTVVAVVTFVHFSLITVVMSPADLVLIALLPTPADLERAQAGWYRLPESAAPSALWQAKALALYQPRSFGEDGLQVAWWGMITGIERTTRRMLLPDDPTHRRADEVYLRVGLSPLQRRAPPLRASKARRLLFAPVRWGLFESATTLDDLFRPAPRPIVDSLMYQLIQSQLEGMSENPPSDDEAQRLFENEEEWILDW
jgi:hypothetical protein